MLGLHQEHERSHIFSFQPSPYQSKTNKEFDFWDEQRTKHRNSYGSQIDFQAQTRAQDDDYFAYSPPLWSRNVNIKQEKPTSLLQKNRHHICPSPTSRLQAILNAERQLMEMVENMPESSYELSLRDIVDEQQTLRKGQHSEELDKTSMNLGTKAVRRTQKKKYSKRPSKISRSESMDSGVFLLKMFIPSFLGSKKKSTSGTDSKVWRSLSFDEPEKPVGGKGWWKIWYPVTILSKSGSSSSSCSNGSNSGRQSDSNFRRDFWFSHNKSISTRRQRGCLF
ncbi:hypothetical protein LguiA_013398 [Lonicera macranthoides]